MFCFFSPCIIIFCTLVLGANMVSSVLLSLQTRVITDFNLLCMDPPQVTGGSGRLYTCFVSCHYCPCPAFSYSVLQRNDGLLVSLKNYVVLKPRLITNPCLRWRIFPLNICMRASLALI